MSDLMNVINIAGTAMSAQSLRLNVTASNMANADVVAGSEDTVYKPRHPIFEAVYENNLRGLDQGVRVREVVQETVPGRKEYRPEHPLANNEGYVFVPNVNMMDEMANMISASRSYEFVVGMEKSAQQLLQRLLQLGQ